MSTSKTPKARDEFDDTESPSESERSRKDHKRKKHASRKGHRLVATAPPGATKGEGGLDARMFGVPGSTPGCTAGAYATEIDPDNLPEVDFAACFPDLAEAGKDWLAANQGVLTLSLLMSKWGPEPCVMDRVNKWLIRRVGRKCAEGTEEGRKDMAALAADAIKDLRALPVVTEATKLYRAVPWKAMGKLAPGLSEFEEESNIVWPTFTSLVKSEKRARDLLKDEGGFLYVIEATQARDVTALAPVQSGADEIMLEPNSQFVITSNENQGKIFVVGMKQEFPSLRPIMKEVDLTRKHHHHHHRHTRAGSVTALVSPVPALPSTAESPTSVVVGDSQRATPVIVKAPPSPAVFATGSKRGSISINNTQVGMRPSSSRLSLPSFYGSRRGSIRQPDMRPIHRSHAALKTDVMTMWSAGKGYLSIKSVACRDKNKVLKLKKQPDWVTAKPAAATEEGEDSKATEEVPSPSKSPESEALRKKIPTVAGADDGSDDESPALSSGSESSDDLLVGLCADPGYGSMILAPNSAPTYIVTVGSADFRTIAGIAPSVLLNRVHRGSNEMI